MEVDGAKVLNTTAHVSPTQQNNGSQAHNAKNKPVVNGAATDSAKENTAANTNKSKVADSDEIFDKEYIRKVIDDANKKIFGSGREFNFSVHEATKRVIIQVLDSNTKEIIKEIPPEKSLNALAKMWELAGLIIDERL